MHPGICKESVPDRNTKDFPFNVTINTISERDSGS